MQVSSHYNFLLVNFSQTQIIPASTKATIQVPSRTTPKSIDADHYTLEMATKIELNQL